MKVSAQPFEPPVASHPADAADRARDEQHHDPAEGVAPIQSVPAHLDPATRESLSQLAMLIRSQMRASDVAREESQEESKERNKLSILKNDVRETEESLAQECIQPDAFPGVARAVKLLRAAERKRGFGVYEQQKSNALVELVVRELADRAEAQSDADAEDEVKAAA